MAENTNLPLVYVVVLNYNGRRHLEYCLPSILATEYRPLRVLVVDNASSDDSVEFVRETFPPVEMLVSEENRGWSGGNNLGIRRALSRGAAYVVLANNDIRVDRRWVTAVVDIMQRDTRIGIVGFQVFEPRDAATVDDSGFGQAVAEWDGLQISESGTIGGMAMFVRGDLFEQIGLIDEGFFAYAEENDLVWRARKAGYRVIGTNIPVWHCGQGTFGRRPLWAASLQIRNNLRLSLKHDSPAGVLYQVARHFAKGCVPFLIVDPYDRIARRLRPSNVFVNFVLWVCAVVWNIWHLPRTLSRRREDQRAIQATRRRLEQL